MKNHGCNSGSSYYQISALPLPFSMIVIAALAAFASTGNAAILSASRYPLALSRDRILWNKFGELNKKRVPRNSVIFTGILSIALVLLLNVQEIAKIASAFLLFVFLTMCIAVIVFRESHKKDYQPKYKSPLYPWLQITGSFIYIWLIWESGLKAVGFIAGVFLLGFLWYHYGIKEKPNFSAAIFYVFQRIGQQEKKDSHLGDIALSFESLNLTAPVEDADFIDLEKEESFDEAVQQAAEALRHRLGGKKERIEEIVKEEMEQWKHPSEFNISVAPILLKGIERPQMVIIRGKIKVEAEEMSGLIVIADDANSTHRLLNLAGQLETAILHTHFPEAWQKAKNATEIKKSLLQDIRSMSVRINSSGPTANFRGSHPTELDLPEQTVVGAVYREGKILSPKNDLSLKEGDEMIFIAKGEEFENFAEQFSEEEQAKPPSHSNKGS